jgi:adenylate cyclase
MLDSVRRINEELRAEQGDGAAQIRIGIGLNTGECVVGNVGSVRRLSYSVLGDPVNLASRLEGQTKAYGVTIILSEDTRRGAEDFAALELDLIAVKGRTTAVRIYALLGWPEQAKTERHRELALRQARLLAAYRAQRWDDAEAEIRRCLELAPELGTLYALYRRRIAVYRASPPGPDWDGIFVATEK